MKIFQLIILNIFLAIQVYPQNPNGVEDARGLEVGAAAPIFSAMDADSSEFSLSEALKTGPVVLMFYRGVWCPVCNKHLSTIQDSLKFINEKGATVVAISPEKPEYLGEMSAKTGAEFRLLYDEYYKISDAYDVTFSPKKSELFMYNLVMGAKLKKAHADDSQRLPIPATYIIDEKGLIVWRQLNPDHKKRASVNDIVKALEAVQR
jgi:peroxiredoxin